MSQTGFAPLATTVDEKNHTLHQIKDAYGRTWDRHSRSHGALRASWHALCDRLPLSEAAQLTAQP